MGDLHATLTPRMGALCDAMIFYRECPHTDAFDSAVLATELLARRLKTGIKPRHLVMVTPDRVAAHRHRHRDGPMRALEDAARRIEKRPCPACLAVNVVGGYAFSDVPYAGRRILSIITEGDEAGGAGEALRELAGIAWDLREGGIPQAA